METYQFKQISKIFDDNYKDKVALIDANKQTKTTYGDLYKMVHKVASEVKTTHNLKDKNVLLFLGEGLSFIVGFYAIILSGNVPVLVSNKLKHELKGLYGLYQLVLSDEDNNKHLKTYEERDFKSVIIKDLKPEPINESIKFDEEVNAEKNMLYYLTSGSTGEGKVVPKKFSNIMLETENLQDFLNIEEGDVFLPLLPTFHAYGLLFEIVLPIYSGSQVELNFQFNPVQAYEVMLRDKVSIVIGSPLHYLAMVNFIDNYQGKDFSFVKHLTTSTMALDVNIVKAFYGKLGIPILEIYGSTEAGGIAYRKYYQNPKWVFFPHIKWRKVGEDNVLEITSPAVSLPEGEKWFSTGDVIEGDDEFDLLGRVNQIIKVGGSRVSGIEVEEMMKKSPDVKDAVVIGVSSNKLRGESIVAYFVPENPDDDKVKAKVKEHCTKNLPDFKQPSKYIRLESIPKSPNGKVQYKKLPEVNF